MTSKRFLSIAPAIFAITLAACDQPADSTVSVAAANTVTSGEHRQYGVPQKVGNGTVRTYVVLDENDGRTPREVGVALSEQALDGLPAPMAMSAAEMKQNPHVMMNVYLLDMPVQNPTPYKFVQFDWNPAGHEPAGIYDQPHFDFHFYRVPVSLRNSIVPTDPQFAAKAASYPPNQYRFPFYLDAATAAGAPPFAVTIPQMGLHWLDVRSPELQMLTGHPELYQTFTKTFIYGSWDGAFIFEEPMITRAYILSKRTATTAAERDEVIPVSTAQSYEPAGYYPNAYRITWDAQAKEYRIALTQLTWRTSN